MNPLKLCSILSVILLTSIVSAPVAHASRSRAEGTDKTAAARASQWVGTVIGVNFGEHSIVITEGVAIDRIKKFAQRSVKITSDTELYKDGEPISFDQLDVGQRITAMGTYNAKKRIVTADRVDVGARVATAPAAKPQTTAAAVASAKNTKVTPIAAKKVSVGGNMQMGSSGANVIALQKFLIAKRYLVMPAGAKLGTFGVQTRDAVQKYQKAVGLPTTGTVGPQTRAKLNKG